MIRIFDIIFSGIAIAILFPILLPLMLILKVTGEHDIFYRQGRIGRNGKEFGLFKFATMLRNSPNMPGGLYTEKNDPRMLPLGNFLRKTKINELPQLINIFIGDMSVIGYRPTVKVHFEAYPENAKKILAQSRPGLSGIGSIAFRNEEEILQKVDDKKKFHQNVINPYKAELECWYYQNLSVRMYFLLIALTAISVVNSRNDLWKKILIGLPQMPNELKEYI